MSLPSMAFAQEPAYMRLNDGETSLRAWEQKARQLKIAGAVSMGLGFAVQGAGLWMLFSSSNLLNPGSSYAWEAGFYGGAAMTAIGSISIFSGAMMHGFGAAYGRTAKAIRTTQLIPSISPMLQGGGRGLSGVTASWQVRF